MKFQVIFFSVAVLGFAYVKGEVGLSDDEKKEVLKAHNHYRGQVDPIAANMERMEWSDELSYMAQFWSANCIYETNENRHTQSTTFDYVGENMLALSSSSANYTLLVNKWFQIGKTSYDFYTGYCRDEDGNQEQCEDVRDCICAPYVQLVWASSYAVGCGATRCQELEGAENGENALFFVCYYGPGGSIVSGESPYQKSDTPCTSCPSDKPICHYNLCSESGAERLAAHLSVMGVLMAVFVSVL